MSKQLQLPKPMYDQIAKLPKGEQLQLVVHHAPRSGTCEVICNPNTKPIKCRIRRVYPKNRGGGSLKNVDVIFTKS